MSTVRASLQCHPQATCPAIESIAVVVGCERPGVLALRYEIRGDLTAIRVPAPVPAAAADGLWAHTCCEVFVAGDAETYEEWNFSPSGQFAHYAFSSYRARAVDPDRRPPSLSIAHDARLLRLDAEIVLADPSAARLVVGIATVVEDLDGRISHWALRHRERPDFHHRDTFALTLDTTA